MDKFIVFLLMERNTVDNLMSHFALVNDMVTELLDFPSEFDIRKGVSNNSGDVLHNGEDIELYCDIFEFDEL